VFACRQEDGPDLALPDDDVVRIAVRVEFDPQALAARPRQRTRSPRCTSSRAGATLSAET
jgi:hypothetical protein